MEASSCRSSAECLWEEGARAQENAQPGPGPHPGAWREGPHGSPGALWDEELILYSKGHTVPLLEHQVIGPFTEHHGIEHAA